MKKSLREIMAPMTWRERLDYIWEYYKWYIIGGLFILIVTGTGISDLINKKDVAFNMFVVTFNADMDLVEELETDLTDWLIPEEEQDKNQVVLHVHPYTKTENGIAFPRGVQEKLLVQMSSQSLDLLLIPEEEFLSFQSPEDGFEDLATLINRPLPFSEEDVIQGTNEEILAIRVVAISELFEIFPDPDLVISVPKNSLQIEKSKTVLEAFIYNSQ